MPLDAAAIVFLQECYLDFSVDRKGKSRAGYSEFPRHAGRQAIGCGQQRSARTSRRCHNGDSRILRSVAKLVWLEQTSFVQEDPFGRRFIPEYFAETSGNKIGGSLV
jgi:hypothetical protein